MAGPYDPVRRTSIDGVVALVCGIIGLFILSIILGPAALFFGLRARRTGGSGLATAGLVLGVIDIALWVIYLVSIGAHRAFL